MKRPDAPSRTGSASAIGADDAIDWQASLALFNSDDLAEIERSLSRETPCDELRAELGTLVFRHCQNSQNPPPGSKPVRATVERLRSATRDFREKIDALASRTTAEDGDALLYLEIIGGPAHDERSVAQLATQLLEFESALASVSRYLLNNRGGRPPDERIWLINGLCKIETSVKGTTSQFTYNYSAEEGEEYSGGPVWKMLRACEHAIAKAENRNPVSDDALARALSRAKSRDKTG